MYREHTIGVVVPAYNEAGFVGEVIDTMPTFVDRVYVVDDCSTDDTWAEIQRHAERRNESMETVDYDPTAMETDGGQPEAVEPDGGVLEQEEFVIGDVEGHFDRMVVPIQHMQNRGVGGAIKTGYQRALADEIDITAVMGGDCQMDPEFLPRLLDPIVEDEAEYTKGNRLVYREYRSGMSRWRFLGNSILTFLTKISSGYWKTMDPQNGYTAISYYALENVGIDGLYEYYGYCNDLLVKLNAKGMRVADVAIPAKYGEEESSISYPSYMWNVSIMLLANFLWRLKVKYLVLDFHPLVLFYWFGAITALAGVMAGGWSMYEWLVQGNALFVRATLSMLLFIMGSMFLMFAMLFDMQVNEDREVQYRD